MAASCPCPCCCCCEVAAEAADAEAAAAAAMLLGLGCWSTVSLLLSCQSPFSLFSMPQSGSRFQEESRKKQLEMKLQGMGPSGIALLGESS